MESGGSTARAMRAQRISPFRGVLAVAGSVLSPDEAAATGRAMAWCHLLAGRCQLRALRELAKAAHAELQRTRSQLTLF